MQKYCIISGAILPVWNKVFTAIKDTNVRVSKVWQLWMFHASFVQHVYLEVHPPFQSDRDYTVSSKRKKEFEKKSIKLMVFIVMCEHRLMNSSSPFCVQVVNVMDRSKASGAISTSTSIAVPAAMPTGPSSSNNSSSNSSRELTSTGTLGAAASLMLAQSADASASTAGVIGLALPYALGGDVIYAVLQHYIDTLKPDEQVS
jgi:hypothetical protein